MFTFWGYNVGFVRCCKFGPAFGCCTLQTLVSIFNVFMPKSWKRKKKQKNWEKINQRKCLDAPKHWFKVFLTEKCLGKDKVKGWESLHGQIDLIDILTDEKNHLYNTKMFWNHWGNNKKFQWFHQILLRNMKKNSCLGNTDRVQIIFF